jgi:carbamoyltransferase
MAHAASIYYPLGLQSAAILTHDGFGSGKHYHSGMYYLGEGHKIFPLAPHHLIIGHIYEQAAIALNMGLIGPAGKLMGLALRPCLFQSPCLSQSAIWRAGITHREKLVGSVCSRQAAGLRSRRVSRLDAVTDQVNVDIAASTGYSRYHVAAMGRSACSARSAAKVCRSAMPAARRSTARPTA